MITAPTLLVSREKTMANLRRMAERAKRHKVALRPHFKTHQSQHVASWIKKMGVTEISVTSLRMAREYANGGWQGITIAMPMNIGLLPQINELAQRVNISVFVNNPQAANALAKDGYPSIRCFTEIDTGYGRTGIPYRDSARLAEVIDFMESDRFRGYYAHSGHTYNAQNPEEIIAIHKDLLEAIEVVPLAKDGSWEAENAVGTMMKISQEHGTAAIHPNFLDQLVPGQQVGILPVHACALVHSMHGCQAEELVVK